MHHFAYRNQELFCEDLALKELAAAYGTPLYVYSAATIRDQYARLESALAGLDHEISYAVKANSNGAILRLLAELDAGFDIVSGGELFRVLRAGAKANRCTFAGVGKTSEEIAYALEEGIYSFHVESEAELWQIAAIAEQKNAIAPIALRVNPNVDARTHRYISTGRAEDKFGISLEWAEKLYERAQQHKNLRVRGLQMHIGSQLTSVDPFVEAIEKVKPLAISLRQKYGIEYWSLGGGIGIPYQQALASGKAEWWKGNDFLNARQYGGKIVPLVKDLGLKILLEPGRFMLGNAGVLITRCLYEKQGEEKAFRVVDAGMNDLIRPSLYEGFHEIVSLHQAANSELKEVNVVGPVCESGDFFAQGRKLPELRAGDLIALMSAGAYGFAMASNYNSRPLPAELLVDGDSARLVRRRQSWEDVVRQEIL